MTLVMRAVNLPRHIAQSQMFVRNHRPKLMLQWKSILKIGGGRECRFFSGREKTGKKSY